MRLLTKTTIIYVLLTLVVLTGSGIALYTEVLDLLYEEVEEKLMYEKGVVDEHLKESDDLSRFYHSYDKQVEVMPVLAGYTEEIRITDTTILITDMEGDTEYLPYRQITYTEAMNDKNYRVAIRMSLIEFDDLSDSIMDLLLWLFAITLVLLTAFNFFVSKRLWSPFNALLRQLNAYSMELGGRFDPPRTGTTEFRDLNAAIASMTSRVERTYRNLKEFTENASHELQTPLAVILSKIETLSQSPGLKEEDATLLNDTYLAARRLSKLNQALLLLARIENGQFPEKDKVRLAGLITEFTDNYGDLIASRNMKVVQSLDPEAGVTMNPVLAGTLVSNLLGNAVRHGAEGGTIEVQLTPQALTVRNTAAGNALDGEAIFLRFRKGDPSSPASTGLGLAIVKKICETHGLEVGYSFEDNTHVFTVRL